MHDNPQVPLTVSPFVCLPAATTLPYTYRTLPSTLPPSSTGAPPLSGDEKTKYVMSSSGHAAHPDDIIASCKALSAYIQKLQDDADRELEAWEEHRAARDLAEKRRVAPGWLDSEARILEPEKKAEGGEHEKGRGKGKKSVDLMDVDVSSAEASGLEKVEVVQKNGEGDDLDRAFGGMRLQK
ncbi:uncharacterized protein RAG0_10549 [Rhynchosporium agropyri]|uniref:Uncharacterized protein n=1 Tax=Rhynchosporium agropyri TaxID=914238 RepID=A0A1E1L090_9HELO|nr:uncharacterized protein RAG0_10549 [Rhynchosporium agropyri]